VNQVHRVLTREVVWKFQSVLAGTLCGPQLNRRRGNLDRACLRKRFGISHTGAVIRANLEVFVPRLFR
jgi:hypothetical protein